MYLQKHGYRHEWKNLRQAVLRLASINVWKTVLSRLPFCTLKTWEAATEAGATNYATLEGGDNPSEHFPKDLGFA
jgi:hypothetical protein